jgi:arylsulfatase A-like enzyme
MIFTDAPCGSSVCTPPRCGLIAGRYAWRARSLRGMPDGFGDPLIASDRHPGPARLERQGVATAAIGKRNLHTGSEHGADAPRPETAQPTNRRARRR